MKKKRIAYAAQLSAASIMLQTFQHISLKWDEYGQILEEEEKKEIEKLQKALHTISMRLQKLVWKLRKDAR